MKDIIIVGGGIAGLSAGIYAQQSGFHATILESHSIPGGFCTSWKRKGYLFEGGMHWLVGSKAGTPLNNLWREVGAIGSHTKIYNRDPFLTYDDGTQRICLYRNPEKLRKHLLAVSPEDSHAINTLCRDINRFGAMGMPVMDVKGVKVRKKTNFPMSQIIKMLTLLPRISKLSNTSCLEYAMQFRHKGIQALLLSIVSDPNFYAAAAIFTLSGLAAGDNGYLEGGSLTLASNMAERFISLGGTIQYNTRVQRVVLQDGVAKGVVVAHQQIPADAVIVTVDTLAAIDTLFEKPLHEPWMNAMRQNTIPCLDTFVCLGVEADFSNIPENLVLPLEKPMELAGVTSDFLYLNNYASFKGYAPEGCTALTTVFTYDMYNYWKQAKEDGSYQQKKKELADMVINRLNETFPQTTNKVTVTDVATPLTYERYCGSYKGSWMSIVPPHQKRTQYKIKPESISGLYFAGQRMMQPGGMPVAVSTGRTAIQHLCKDADVMFQGALENTTQK